MIQLLKNGRHKVTVLLPQTDGTRRRVCRTVDTRGDAERLEAQLRAKPSDAHGQTVGAALERYMRLHGPAMAPNSERAYEGVMRRYVRDCWIGGVRLDQLDPDTLETYYAQLLAGTYRPHGRPLAVRTVQQVARLIRNGLGDVVRQKWVTLDQYVPARVIASEPSTAVLDDYDLDDVGRVLAGADADLGDVVQLALATGARRGELAGLRWHDVDLLTGAISIREAITRGRLSASTYHVRGETKTRKRRRVVVDAAALEMLNRRYYDQSVRAEAAGIETLDDRAVLSRTLERDYTSPERLGAAWRAACKRAGVTLRFHDLRHVNTSELIAAGVPAVNVATRNGWSSTKMLHDTYAHARSEIDERATDALASVWRRIETHRTS